MNPNTGDEGYCPVCGEWLSPGWNAHVRAHRTDLGEPIKVLDQPRNRAERRAAEKMARRAK